MKCEKCGREDRIGDPIRVLRVFNRHVSFCEDCRKDWANYTDNDWVDFYLKLEAKLKEFLEGKLKEFLEKKDNV